MGFSMPGRGSRRACAVAVVVVVGLALVVTGCSGGAQDLPARAVKTTQAAVSSSPAVPESLTVPEQLDCGYGPIPRSVLDDPQPAAEIPADVVASTGVDPDAGWFVARASGGDTIVLRPDDPITSPVGGRIGYELIGFSDRDDPAGALSGRVFAATSCVFTRQLPAGATALAFIPVEMDPARSTLALNVSFADCAPGPLPAEEARVAALRITDDAVEVALVADADWWGTGATTCVGYAPTRVEVDLPVPLGGRRIVNAAYYPSPDVTHANPAW